MHIRHHFLRHPHSLSSPHSHRRLFSLSSTPAARQAVLGRIDLTPPREGEWDLEGRVYDPRLRSEVRVFMSVGWYCECDWFSRRFPVAALFVIIQMKHGT